MIELLQGEAIAIFVEILAIGQLHVLKKKVNQLDKEIAIIVVIPIIGPIHALKNKPPGPPILNHEEDSAAETVHTVTIIA